MGISRQSDTCGHFNGFHRSARHRAGGVRAVRAKGLVYGALPNLLSEQLIGIDVETATVERAIIGTIGVDGECGSSYFGGGGV